MEIAIAILGILAAAVPFIIRALTASQAKKEKDTDALVSRDIDVLHGPPTGGVQPDQKL